MRVIVFIFVIILIVCIVYHSTKKENFGQVTGALYPYRKELAQCFDECDRQDPTKRLTGPNMFCGLYCQNKFTEKSKRGIPPGEGERMPIIERCRKQCSDAIGETGDCTNRDLLINKCVGVCACKQQAVDRCWYDMCPYTTNKEKCMKECVDITLPNCDQVSWTWRLP